jgi:hypothetical protein
MFCQLSPMKTRYCLSMRMETEVVTGMLLPSPADAGDGSNFDVHGALKIHQVRTRLTVLSNPKLSYSYNSCSEYHYVL